MGGSVYVTAFKVRNLPVLGHAVVFFQFMEDLWGFHNMFSYVFMFSEVLEKFETT